MRKRRFSFVAGWVAVAVLALAGFAAFGTPDGTTDELRAEAVAASIGHTAGQYAGLSFVVLGGSDTAEAVVVTSDDQDGESPEEDTSASDTASDELLSTSSWLSQIEVRVLVEEYFEPADVNKAVRIAWCESRFDPQAHDLKTGGVGLFNHLPQYWEERADNAGFTGADPTDPEASTAAAAWEVYNGAGWEIFSCR